MGTQVSASNTLEIHMKALESDDGMLRQSAREALVALGGRAVAPLAQALGSAKSHQVRWEAAKALGAMGEVRAIPALVAALEDSDSDVIWLAAEALSAFGKEAWPALLKALVAEGTESVILRKGAHHVFANQQESSGNGILAPLQRALEAGALPEAAPMEAIEVLTRLNAHT
ncbi:MAG: HEAT repeat domain-containing protein [Humidesulfovibrio sp.]|nr:HEAT repeat domain-containing protein [Humidesulfovibrio sp.]